jgi:AcrR family transcriptional regulator
MLRTRAAILDATAGCIERYGVRKTTMSDVASKGGVAKATLYNHFRTKDDLLKALVLARVEALASECAELAAAGLGPALEHAGRWLDGCRPVRRVAADDPALLAALGTPGSGRLWDAARGAVGTVLREAGAPSDAVAVDLVLRWLCGHVMWPGSPEEVAAGARLLAVGLGRAPEPVVTVVDVAAPGESPAVAGVGWPS